MDSTVSIVEKETLNIRVYPNPFENYTAVEFDNPQSEHYTVKLIDVRGRLVHHQEVITERLVIYRNQMQRGIYYLEVDGKRKAREIVIIQ
ncbi:MAG: T9SS type A sorting domain-containing protein [Flavobacteriales bacterium]|nr:T9SS type A sorting domain-containing protein [Flavobacteriales bacterium]MBL6872649.1 T9SS type A sorting domain-containing protein [Flavobacteriales bacterium]